jgi:light-regulated signal transduction histidine kinase (bacteriophytochrome)
MPGTLQDFGCLVVLGADHTIRQASSNVSRYLARSAASVIGAPFSAVVDLSLCPQVLDVLARPSSPRRVTLHRVRY